MKQFFKKQCLAILLCCLLCGCSTPRSDISSQSQTNPSQATAQDEEKASKEYTVCTACTDSGCYVTEYIYPDSCSLFYLDFQTGQQMFLCGKPECRHDSEDCTSYFSMEKTAPPQPYVIGDKLLYLYTGTRDNAPARIEISHLDGSEKKVLFSIGPNQIFMGNILSDGKDIYCQLGNFKIVGDTTEFTEQLVKISTDTGNMQILHTYPVNDLTHLQEGGGDGKIAMFTLGAWDEERQQYDETKLFWHWYDPTVHPAVESEPFLVCDESEEGAFIENGKLYRINYKACSITMEYLATGKTVTWDYNKLLPENTEMTFAGLIPLFPGWLRLSLPTDNGDGQLYLLNEEDPGSFLPMQALTRSYDSKEIVVVGTYQDKMCVIRDYYEDPVLEVIDGEEQLTTVVKSIYAMIPIEDYVNGRANYQDMPLINAP